MALDPVRNFAISRVATAPSPATSGTTLVLDEGDGALFPAPATSGAFNVVIYPNGEQPDSTNAEIVRVTARSADTLTIVREQEGTSARTIVVGDIVMLGITAKMVEDLDDIATTASNLATEFNGGWIDAGETWTYASADDPTFTFTISGDKTGKYSAGMRIKLTQTSVKYFIITAVSYSSPNTTITVYGGTDYDLANATITNPYYSTQKAPQGFPLSPLKWTVSVTDTTIRSQASPVSGTWYNIGSISISIPIGVWNVQYKVTPIVGLSSASDPALHTTLSTTNNSSSDSGFDMMSYMANIQYLTTSMVKGKTIALTSKTTYYLNTKGVNVNINLLRNDNNQSPLLITATCAYL